MRPIKISYFITLTMLSSCYSVKKSDMSHYSLDDYGEYLDINKEEEVKKHRRPCYSSAGVNDKNDEYYYYDDYYYDDEEGQRDNVRRKDAPNSRYNYGKEGNYNEAIDKNEIKKAEGSNFLTLLMAPLAGISLLAAAAAVAFNPVLISVSPLSGGGRRRKRSVEKSQILNYLKIPDHLQGVPGHAEIPDELVNIYLNYSGLLDEGSLCLDRIACEYSLIGSKISEAHEYAHISRFIYSLLTKKRVSRDLKMRFREAAELGKTNLDACKERFHCSITHVIRGAKKKK